MRGLAEPTKPPKPTKPRPLPSALDAAVWDALGLALEVQRRQRLAGRPLTPVVGVDPGTASGGVVLLASNATLLYAGTYRPVQREGMQRTCVVRLGGGPQLWEVTPRHPGPCLLAEALAMDMGTDDPPHVQIESPLIGGKVRGHDLLRLGMNCGRFAQEASRWNLEAAVDLTATDWRLGVCGLTPGSPAKLVDTMVRSALLPRYPMLG